MNYFTFIDIYGNECFVAVDSENNYSIHYKDENDEWDDDEYTDFRQDGGYTPIEYNELPVELQEMFSIDLSCIEYHELIEQGLI